VNYAKLLEISSFFTWHIFLEVGKTQDIPSKIWQTLEDALSCLGFSRYIDFAMHLDTNIYLDA